MLGFLHLRCSNEATDNVVYAGNEWKFVCNQCKHIRNLENNVILYRGELDNVTEILQRVKSEGDKFRQMLMQTDRLPRVGDRKSSF